jgi:hypothetical protein
MRVIRRLLARLVAVVVLSPIALLVILGLGALLHGVGDRGGAVVCGRVLLIGGVIWLVGVIGMALLTAVMLLAGPPPRSGRRCGETRWGDRRGPGRGRRRRRRWQRGEPTQGSAERRRQRGDPGGAAAEG